MSTETSRTAAPARRRRRDPERRERILGAAARLAASRGFHTVGMAEIGAEAGIVGSGVYRHFDSKDAILLALLDRGMSRLEDGATAVLARAGSDRETLSSLVRDHISVVVVEYRAEMAVYHREVHTLPEEERRALRRRQRHYVEEWVHVLAPLRRDLADGELRLAVHAAVGAIQSTLFYRSGVPADRLTALLATIAHASLGVEPH